MKIVKLDSTESTNRYCEALDLAEVEDFLREREKALEKEKRSRKK